MMLISELEYMVVSFMILFYMKFCTSTASRVSRLFTTGGCLGCLQLVGVSVAYNWWVSRLLVTSLCQETFECQSCKVKKKKL